MHEAGFLRLGFVCGASESIPTPVEGFVFAQGLGFRDEGLGFRV